MDRMEAEDFSLFGLLGRSWHLDAPVVDLTFDNSDGAVAFSLADGSVAIAKTKDSEPAAKRIRISGEDGRSSILPRTNPLPPITRFSVQGDDKPVALSAYGKHGFVIGDASGILTSLTAGGERTPFGTSIDAPIIALDHAGPTGDLACATADHQVILVRRGRTGPEALNHEKPIGALAFSPEGSRIATAIEGQVTLWEITDRSRPLDKFTPCQQPISLAWSPDQSKLALGQETGGVNIWQLADGTVLTLPDYPTATRSLAWSSDSETLVTSGAFRVVAWPVGHLMANSAPPTSLDTGKPGLATVEALAIHPTRPLIAAGYENGMLIITQVGRQDELVIKAEGLGSISSVKWSHDAGSIAIGSRRGLATIIELPLQLFK